MTPWYKACPSVFSRQFTPDKKHPNSRLSISVALIIPLLISGTTRWWIYESRCKGCALAPGAISIATHDVI